MSLTRFFKDLFTHNVITLQNMELINVPTQESRVFIRAKHSLRQRGVSSARTTPTPINDNRVLFTDKLILKCKIPRKSSRKSKFAIRLSIRLESDSGSKSKRFGIVHIKVASITSGTPTVIEIPLEKCNYQSIFRASAYCGDAHIHTPSIDQDATTSTESMESTPSDELLELEEHLGIHIDENRFEKLEAQVDDILLVIVSEHNA